MYFDFGCAGSWLLCVGFLWRVSSSLAAVLRLLIVEASLNVEHGHAGFSCCSTWL